MHSVILELDEHSPKMHLAFQVIILKKIGQMGKLGSSPVCTSLCVTDFILTFTQFKKTQFSPRRGLKPLNFFVKMSLIYDEYGRPFM